MHYRFKYLLTDTGGADIEILSTGMDSAAVDECIDLVCENYCAVALKCVKDHNAPRHEVFVPALNDMKRQGDGTYLKVMEHCMKNATGDKARVPTLNGRALDWVISMMLCDELLPMTEYLNLQPQGVK